MEEKLQKLYQECINELKAININVMDNPEVGEIDVTIAKRNAKRYGCCKQEEPDKKYRSIVKQGRKRIVKYERFNKHHIEISKWVMDLNDDIIKNTIMHEIIHCIPYCNNHGKVFKRYANYINQKLGYHITRLGNKEADYKESNLELEDETSSYKYKIICKDCGQIYYRKRLQKNLIQKYRCGKCNGKLQIQGGIK